MILKNILLIKTVFALRLDRACNKFITGQINMHCQLLVVCIMFQMLMFSNRYRIIRCGLPNEGLDLGEGVVIPH